jgi:hypothetical protein
VRVWDVSPGYLNRQSLLGEHRELHGIASILLHGKTGYSRHPETMRWARALGGLAARHDHLAAEMRLRGYVDRTPVAGAPARVVWPAVFVTEPGVQLDLLRRKYVGREKGRISLPRTPQQAWAQHEYSVMARSPEAYRRLGRWVAGRRSAAALDGLMTDLVELLRQPPSAPRVVTAIDHMWAHLRRHAQPDERAAAARRPADALACVQAIALRVRDRRLLTSTALSDLAVFLEPRHPSGIIRP